MEVKLGARIRACYNRQRVSFGIWRKEKDQDEGGWSWPDGVAGRTGGGTDSGGGDVAEEDSSVLCC